MEVESAASRAAAASAASWALDLGFLSSACGVVSRLKQSIKLRSRKKRSNAYLALFADAPLCVGFLLDGLGRLDYCHRHVVIFFFLLFAWSAGLRLCRGFFWHQRKDAWSFAG